MMTRPNTPSRQNPLLILWPVTTNNRNFAVVCLVPCKCSAVCIALYPSIHTFHIDIQATDS